MFRLQRAKLLERREAATGSRGQQLPLLGGGPWMAQGQHQGGRDLWQERLGHKATAEQGRRGQVGKSPKPRGDPRPKRIKLNMN